jgi:hypothetical protein
LLHSSYKRMWAVKRAALQLGAPLPSSLARFLYSRE